MNPVYVDVYLYVYVCGGSQTVRRLYRRRGGFGHRESRRESLRREKTGYHHGHIVHNCGRR